MSKCLDHDSLPHFSTTKNNGVIVKSKNFKTLSLKFVNLNGESNQCKR